MKRWVVGVVTALSFSIVASRAAAGPLPAAGGPWSAGWIWQASDGPKNAWMCFRKTVDLNAIPGRATARVAVDSKYWLWVNGKLAVFEGGLNRGPTPTGGYYDVVDLKPFLARGRNTVAVLVWYWGNQGRNSVDSGKGGLVFEADLGGTTLRSDGTWKAAPHPAYGPTGDPLPSYLYAGYNIGFDAPKDIPGWTDAGFDDSAWPAAVEKGTPPARPWGELWERPIPRWRDSGLIDYTNDAALPKEGDGTAVVATLPYAAHLTPYFKIDAAEAGLKVDVRTDRYTVQGYNGHRAEYTTRAGVQEFESLDWALGESVRYTFPRGVKVLALKYRRTGYDVDFAGSFSCDDPFYNTLFEKARRTLYVCMRDNYMDCPDRERGQWIGDVASQVPQTFYALGRGVDPLTLKCVRDFVLSRKGDVLTGLVPGSQAHEYASQSLAAVGERGLAMTYYQNTGDDTPVRETYGPAKRYLALWAVGPGGSIRPRSNWNDWGKKNDNLVLETLWYYSALKAAAAAATLTGHDQDAADDRALAGRIAGGFDRLYWKGDGYRSGTFTDERANAMAVLTGLAVKEKAPAVAKVLNSVKNASPYMEGYVEEALFVLGHDTNALTRMKDRYGLMVNDANCSTLWENFQDHEPTPKNPDGTKNHAWSGGPLTCLFRCVAGVAPESAGYGTFHVLPQMGTLKEVAAVVPSVKGDIRVALSRGASRFTLDLTSPAGTTAVVGIPKGPFLAAGKAVGEIRSGDAVIWSGGTPKPGAGVSWVGEDEAYYRFSVGPGAWRLSAVAAP